MRIRHDGLEFVADAYGSPDADPVLLLHGGGQTRHAWTATARGLADGGWYAVAVDLRGHGDSGWSPTGAYELEDFAADVHAVATAIGRPMALVGASLGGMSAMTAIGQADHPADLATALVLVDVAARLEEHGLDRIRSFMTGNPDGFADLEQVADAIAAYNPNRPPSSNLDGLRKNLRRRRDGRWRWHWDPAVIASHGPESRQERFERRLVAAAPCVTVPTLVVRGEQSDLLSVEGVRHLVELIPHAEVADVAGAGHMVAGDRNDAFNDAIVGFLGRVRSTAV